MPPLIESGDCTVSGSNTASTSWAVSHPVAATGDLLIFYIAWDDSLNTTGVTPPSGPNGETITAINTTPVTDGGTETRAKAWYTKATGAWSASTVTFTPSASESWSATVVKVPAGEFDPTTPIGAFGTSADSSGGTDTTVDSPAFSAGATDGGGTLLWFAGVDTDPLGGTNPTGWTILQAQDLGAVAHGVAKRNAAITDSESIASATWAIAGDSWTSIAFIVRALVFDHIRQDIIDGLDSAQSEAAGWNAEVRDALAVSSVVRTSDTVVTITLPALASYEITAQETITVTVPTTALASGGPLTADPTFTVDESGGPVFGDLAAIEDEVASVTAFVRVSSAVAAVEDETAGAAALVRVFTSSPAVEDEVANATTSPFDAIRQAIIDGLDSAQSEATGWNAEVRDTLPVSAVVRTSDTVVTITLPAVPGYDITAPETITVTVPAAALDSGGPLTATPTFGIAEVAGGPVFSEPVNFIEDESGSATPSVVVASAVAAVEEEQGAVETGVTVFASAAAVEDEVADAQAFTSPFAGARQAIIDGLDSAQSELTGWNNEVRDSLPLSAVVRTSDTVVTITLPPIASYEITAPETITVTVPAAALQSGGPLTAAPTFGIAEEAGGPVFSEPFTAVEDEAAGAAVLVRAFAGAAAIENEALAEPPDTTIYVDAPADAVEDEVADASVEAGGPVFSEAFTVVEDETASIAASVRVTSAVAALEDEQGTVEAGVTVFASASAVEDEQATVRALDASQVAAVEDESLTVSAAVYATGTLGAIEDEAAAATAFVRALRPLEAVEDETASIAARVRVSTSVMAVEDEVLSVEPPPLGLTLDLVITQPLSLSLEITQELELDLNVLVEL